MSEEEIKYSIQKVFGRYSICIENGTTVESYFDVQETIIKIIKQLEQENTHLKSVLKEIREYIENNTYSSACTMKTTLHLQNDELYDLLEIIDKAGIGEDNG